MLGRMEIKIEEKLRGIVEGANKSKSGKGGRKG